MPLTDARIQSRQAVVGIVGLGYVGLPLALTFAEAGVVVHGFDVDAAKIASLAAGRSYLNHIPASRLQAVQPRFAAHGDFAGIVACDAVIICVPTPVDQHLQPDLTCIESTARAITPHLAPHTLVVLESTTWPGTTEEVVRPIIEQGSPRRLGTDLYLAFSPEREDPGNPRFCTKTIPKLVGGADPASQRLAAGLYRLAIDTVVEVSSMRVAETAKLFENIFRWINIALVNEMKMVLDRMGIDTHEVIAAAATKPFGFMAFKPGPGLGGHCIPIDPYYLSWKAKEFGLSCRFIELAGEVNRAMPRWVVEKVADCLNLHRKAVNGSRVLVLGLAYKADVDDMRESPSLEIIELLEAKGAQVSFHDPFFPAIPASRHYRHLAGRQGAAPSAAFDCMVLVTNHRCYTPESLLAHGVPIVDTRHVLPAGPLVVPA